MIIVTGYTGAPHVTSNAAQALNQGIFGSGNCVLNVGNKFAATLTDANTVTIQSGEGVLQGVHFRIDPGTTEAVTISNGTSGYNRIDLICARYTKNAITGVENVSLVVVEGTPDASTPTEPTINSGDILTGDSPVDFPLYKVSLSGITPTLSAIFATPTQKVIDISESIAANNYHYAQSNKLEAGTYLIVVNGVAQPGSSATSYARFTVSVPVSYGNGEMRQVATMINNNEGGVSGSFIANFTSASKLSAYMTNLSSVSITASLLVYAVRLS